MRQRRRWPQGGAIRDLSSPHVGGPFRDEYFMTTSRGSATNAVPAWESDDPTPGGASDNFGAAAKRSKGSWGRWSMKS